MKSALLRIWAVTRVVLRLWVASLILSAIALGVSGLVAGRNLTTIGGFLRSGEGVAPSALPLKLVRPLWWFGTNQPGVQVLRLVPGAAWIPQSLSAVSASWGAVSTLADHSLRLAKAADEGVFKTDGSFDHEVTGSISRDATKMTNAVSELEGLIRFLEENRGPWWRHPSRSATVQELWRAHRAAHHGLRTIEVVEPFALSKTPRSVFVGITNPAESRGVHGIIGQYAIIEISQDGINVRGIDSNLALRNPTTLPTTLSAGYEDFYGSNNTEWQNMTLSPFVDDAAEQIEAAWQAGRRERLDAVLLLDTVALARTATANGENYMTAQGRLLTTAQALSDYLSNGIYLEFPEDNLARKEFQTDLGRAMVSNVLQTVREAPRLTTQLATSLAEGRIVFWARTSFKSTNETETFIGLSSEALEPNDVVVRLNNFTGNKMDFYLKPSLVVKQCATSTEVVIQLQNTAPPREQLPDYVLRRLDPIGGDPASFVGLSLTVGPGWDVVQWTELDSLVESRLSFQPWGQRLRIWLEIPIGNAKLATVVLAPTFREAHLPRFDLAPLAASWSESYTKC
jgi:hypothetical protein